jgi:hypothetical protein
LHSADAGVVTGFCAMADVSPSAVLTFVGFGVMGAGWLVAPLSAISALILLVCVAVLVAMALAFAANDGTLSQLTSSGDSPEETFQEPLDSAHSFLP